MKKLDIKDIELIERGLNQAGVSEVVVKIEQGKVIVLMSKRKRIM